MSQKTMKTKCVPQKLKVQNGFIVNDFITKSGIDFVYAKKEDGYRLLNLSMMGDASGESVDELVNAGFSVAIIEGLNMEVFNLDEDKLKLALIG